MPPWAAALLLASTIASAPAAAQERIGSALLSREGSPAAMRIRVGATIEGQERPAMSGEVTAIPYDPTLPTVQLAIKRLSARRESECTSKRTYHWIVELADIADPAYLAYAKDRGQGHIGDAVVVYPPRPKAKVMDSARVAQSELPPGYTQKQLRYAIDFDADGRADYVEIMLCCAPLERDGTCASGNSCRKAFRRSTRVWREIWHRDEC